MVLENIKKVYFVGIGGIGMSAIARYFNAKGVIVGGYDKVETDLTRILVAEGIYITYEDKIVTIPLEYMDRENTLIVYTPAVPSNHKQLNYFRNNNFRVGKRSEVLGFIAKNSKLIGIAGTHGKTTVSTFASFLLDNSTVGCSAFLGGISKNFDSNLVSSKDSNWVVMEADEYDRSFLKLFPNVAVITSIDADHLDIYGSYMEIKKTFNTYVSQVDRNGCLIYKYGLEISNHPKHSFSYSLDNQDADYYASDIKLEDGAYIFNLHTPYSTIKSLKLNYPGRVNIENAIVAMAVTLYCGATPEELLKALPEFKGVKRRFDLQFKSDNCIYIDDYAHHPKELEASILSVKAIYPNRKLTGIFQPHLYSRTKDFAEDFAISLGYLDRLLLLDIYPAREEPISGVSSSIIANKMKIPTSIINKADLLKELNVVNEGVILTLGAGDIDRLVAPITEMLENKYNNK